MTRHHSFKPGQIWPDTDGVHINAHGGGILHHDGVYYWFGEHKIEGEAGNRAHVGVSVYASTDLYNWTNRGVALAVHDNPQSPITRGCTLERPKVIHHPRSGKFVMWFHLELKGQGYKAALAAVATAEHVTGPYTFQDAFRINANRMPVNSSMDQDQFFQRDLAAGQMSRDQTVYVDPNDGAAYQFTASENNQTMHVSRLRDDDWCNTTGEFSRQFIGRAHEAPAPFFHNGRYWMFSSHCTGWKPNPGRLSVADHPLGPWRELPNPCRGTPEQLATTFESQSTYVLPVVGKPGAFIFLADRWRPDNAIDGRYVWLPVLFDADGTPYLEWRDEWDLSVFER